LKNNVFDKWLWRREYPFSVKGVYSILTGVEYEESLLSDEHALAWNKLVPLKVYVFIQCFLVNIIPTRDNLF
jgi:hypothetical protein